MPLQHLTNWECAADDTNQSVNKYDIIEPSRDSWPHKMADLNLETVS